MLLPPLPLPSRLLRSMWALRPAARELLSTLPLNMPLSMSLRRCQPLRIMVGGKKKYKLGFGFLSDKRSKKIVNISLKRCMARGSFLLLFSCEFMGGKKSVSPTRSLPSDSP